MRRYTNEFKVGLFVIFCLAGLFYLTYSTGKLNIKRDGYYLYVVFDEIAGLEKKAPVMLNGLEVGKVEDIQAFYEQDKTRLKLKLWLEKNARVRRGATVSIKTLGLMGEKYIQISSYKGESFLGPESVLLGKPYLDLDVLMEEADNLSKEVGVLIKNVNLLTAEVKKIATGLSLSVERNQDEVDRIVSNLEATSKNIEELSQELKHHPWKLLYKPKEK